MKRFFCDCCGKQLDYRNKAVANTNEAKHTVMLTGQHKVTLEVSLRIEIKAATLIPPVDNRPHWQRGGFNDDPPQPVRQHADLCEACRWGLIEKLRAEHPLAEDTPFGTDSTPLAWGDPTD